MSKKTKSTQVTDPSKNPIQFLGECREELKKVSYPNRAQTVQATGITLFIICFVALVLALLDLVFNRLMEVVL